MRRVARSIRSGVQRLGAVTRYEAEGPSFVLPFLGRGHAGRNGVARDRQAVVDEISRHRGVGEKPDVDPACAEQRRPPGLFVIEAGARSCNLG